MIPINFVNPLPHLSHNLKLSTPQSFPLNSQTPYTSDNNPLQPLLRLIQHNLSHTDPLAVLLPMELHRRRQTRNLLLIGIVDISNDAVLARRDLLGQFHGLGQFGLLVLLQRTGQVDFGDGVAEVGGLADDGDEAVFDGQVDFGALVDVFREGAFGGDLEGLAAGSGEVS